MESVELKPESPIRRLSIPETDHSLSVGAVLAPSSTSLMLLQPAPLWEPDPDADARLSVDEDALVSRSFDFSFSSKFMKIRLRAASYAASRS